RRLDKAEVTGSSPVSPIIERPRVRGAFRFLGSVAEGEKWADFPQTSHKRAASGAVRARPTVGFDVRLWMVTLLEFTGRPVEFIFGGVGLSGGAGNWARPVTILDTNLPPPIAGSEAFHPSPGMRAPGERRPRVCAQPMLRTRQRGRTRARRT